MPTDTIMTSKELKVLCARITKNTRTTETTIKRIDSNLFSRLWGLLYVLFRGKKNYQKSRQVTFAAGETGTKSTNHTG